MKKLTIINPVIFVIVFLLALCFININFARAQTEKTCPGGHKGDEHTFTGSVKFLNNFGRDTNATHGIVKLFKVNPPSADVIAVDSATINQSGIYIMNGVPAGDYYIVAYPNDKIEDFVVAFYPSGQLFSSATRIVIPPGPGTIHFYNVRSELMYKTGGATPVQGETADSGNHNYKLKNSIITAKSGTQWRGFAITDNQGKYIVNSILPGNYSITSSRFGYRNQTQNVNIGTTTATVNFYMARDTASSIGINSSSEVVKDFKLNQNFPNPFNPCTDISFSLDRGMDVKLAVYSMNGKLIEELVNGYRNAGEYRISFNAASLASGIYNYTLETGNGLRESRIMVLTK